MFQVAAVIERRQIADEAEAADGSPADELNEAIGRIGVRSDQHGAAGVLAVVKGEKEAAAGVPLGFFVGTQMECAALELHQADEDSEQIAEMTQRFEGAIGECTNVSRESNAENVEGKNFPGSVREANEIDGTSAAGEQRLHRGFRAIVREIAEERVAGAEREKAK